MKEKFGYKSIDPTHGELVTIGTIISIYLFAEKINDLSIIIIFFSFINQLRSGINYNNF